jgi:hypothetical protein
MTQDRPSEHRPPRPDPGSTAQPSAEDEVNAGLDEASSLAADLVQEVGPPDADDELRRNDQNLAEPRRAGEDRAGDVEVQLDRMEQLLDTAAEEVGNAGKVPVELLARFQEHHGREEANPHHEGSPCDPGAPGGEAEDAMTGPASNASIDLPDFMSDLTGPDPEENQRPTTPPSAFHNELTSGNQTAGNAAPARRGSDPQARPATDARTTPLRDSQERKPTSLDDSPSEITLNDMASLQAAAAALGGTDEEVAVGPGGPELGDVIETPEVPAHLSPSQPAAASMKTTAARRHADPGAPGVPRRHRPRRTEASAMLIGRLSLPARSLCSWIVAVLEWLDRPLASVDLRIKTVIGWFALATLATSLIVITLSMF